MPLYRQTKSQELSTEIINCLTGGKSVTETRFSLKNYKTLKIVIKLLRKQNWGHVNCNFIFETFQKTENKSQ